MQDIAAMRIDFHTHILPKIDDGSDSVETSLQLIRALQEQGIGVIALTPHYSAWQDPPEKFLRKRSESMEILREKLPHDHPTLLCGAEIYYYEGLDSMVGLERLCLEGTNCLLVEMPYGHWSDRAVSDINTLNAGSGFRVMLAHVERYLKMGNAKAVKWLSDQGLMIQCNAEFFLNRFSRHKAMSMLRKGEIQAIGSDCHDLTKRVPNCGEAYDLIRDKGGDDAEAYLLRQGAMILNSLTNE